VPENPRWGRSTLVELLPHILNQHDVAVLAIRLGEEEILKIRGKPES
jgi:hypothetical protein